MASGVNVKMGVSGVAQFKQSMNQAKQSVKTLDAQLALTEKQFKANGDSQSYMTEKTELLKAKLEQQKTVVENAEKALDSMVQNGVERSSTAYQNLYRDMLTAKGAMVDTESQLENLGTAGDDAATGVENADTALSNIGKGISYQNVTDSLGKISDGLGKIIKKAWQAGEELVRATLGAGSWADELQETADKMSIEGDWVITPEELQRMQKTSQIIDTDVDSIVAARRKLLKGMGGEDKDVFAFLHDNNIPTQGRKTEDVFWEVGESIMNVKDAAEQEAIAQKVLGKSWSELKPLFTAGRKEYEEMNASWSVVSNDQINSLTEMDDAYQKMSAEWETFKMEMLSAFSGPLTEGMETITGLFKELNEYLQSEEGKEKLAQIGDTISGLISGLTSIDPETIVQGLQGVIDKITDGLQWIQNNKDTVVTAVEAIIAAWAGLKVASGLTTVLKLVSAVQGISGASAAQAGATAGSSWASSFATAAMKAAPFLAFLYTLLNPASSADNDLDMLWDENGNPTTEARDAGITMTQQEAEESGFYYPEWRKAEDLQAVQDKLTTGYTGDTETAEERNRRILANRRSMNESTMGSSSYVISWASEAMRKALNGMKVVMDGETVGQLVYETVSELIAGEIE